MDRTNSVDIPSQYGILFQHTCSICSLLLFVGNKWWNYTPSFQPVMLFIFLFIHLFIHLFIYLSIQVNNYYVAAGMNSTGIAAAGGVGKMVSEWIVSGEPSSFVWSMDIRRFVPLHNNNKFLKDRVTETLGECFLSAFLPLNLELCPWHSIESCHIHKNLALPNETDPWLLIVRKNNVIRSSLHQFQGCQATL